MQIRTGKIDLYGGGTGIVNGLQILEDGCPISLIRKRFMRLGEKRKQRAVAVYGPHGGNTVDDIGVHILRENVHGGARFVSVTFYRVLIGNMTDGHNEKENDACDGNRKRYQNPAQ